MNESEKYLITGDSVQNVQKIYEDGDNYFFVPSNQIFTIKKDKTNLIFKNKFDAMYFLLVKRLKSKKSTLKNYKSSKFFKQYIERLKIQNPELIF